MIQAGYFRLWSAILMVADRSLQKSLAQEIMGLIWTNTLRECGVLWTHRWYLINEFLKNLSHD